jgi:hypothetical protein
MQLLHLVGELAEQVAHGSWQLTLHVNDGVKKNPERQLWHPSALHVLQLVVQAIDVFPNK